MMLLQKRIAGVASEPEDTPSNSADDDLHEQFKKEASRKYDLDLVLADKP